MSDETPDLTALLAEHREIPHRRLPPLLVSGCECGWGHEVAAHSYHLAEQITAAGFGPVRAVEAERDAARCEGLAPFCCNNPDCPVHGERIDPGELDAARLVGDMAEAEVVTLRARAESAEAALAGLREGVQEVIDARGRGDFAALLPKLRALLPTPDREEARDE